MPQNEHLLPRNNGNHCEYFAEFFRNGIPFKTLVSVGKKRRQESAPFTVYNFVHVKESLKQNISIHKNALKKFSLQTKCLHQISYVLSLSKALVALVSAKSLTPPLNKWGERFGKALLQTDAVQLFLFVPIPAKVKISLVFFQSINFLCSVL
jgi:hypothetical protein